MNILRFVARIATRRRINTQSVDNFVTIFLPPLSFFLERSNFFYAGSIQHKILDSLYLFAFFVPI